MASMSPGFANVHKSRLNQTLITLIQVTQKWRSFVGKKKSWNTWFKQTNKLNCYFHKQQISTYVNGKKVIQAPKMHLKHWLLFYGSLDWLKWYNAKYQHAKKCPKKSNMYLNLGRNSKCWMIVEKSSVSVSLCFREFQTKTNKYVDRRPQRCEFKLWLDLCWLTRRWAAGWSVAGSPLQRFPSFCNSNKRMKSDCWGILVRVNRNMLYFSGRCL